MAIKNKKGEKTSIYETMNILWKKVYEEFKKYLSTNILFLTYLITSVIIGFLLRLTTSTSLYHIKPLICDLIIVAIVGAFGYLIKPKHQFKYFFLLNIFYTALCIINSIYYKFYAGYISISQISTLSMFGKVSDSVTSRLKPIYFIYLISPIIMLIVHHFLSKKNYYFNVGRYEKGKQMFLRTVVVSFALLLMTAITLTKTEASRIVKLWNRDYVVNKFGIYMYTINDFVQSIYPTISPMFGYEEAKVAFDNYYYNNKNNKQKNNYTNIFEGKNVLFIHAESIQSFLIGLEVNGIEITPNLNKLAKESLYFTRFYPQVSIGTSSDTEFTLSTGILPSSSGTVFINFYNRKYETMQNAFRSKGYYTFAAHANAAGYWNRETMYQTLGYDDFYAKDSYIVPDDMESEDIIGLGLSDKSFYKQLIPILKEVKNNHEKFMGTIISLSNHSPFKDLDKYGDIDFSVTVKRDTKELDEEGNPIYEEVEDPYLENTEIGDYLKSAHYADEAYGMLLEMLEEENLLDNTVIVLYGDHEAKLGRKNLEYLYNYDLETGKMKTKDDPTYVNLDDYNYDLLKNTPLIIYSKDDKVNKEISSTMGMWDVYPTIANMFNLNYRYPLGHDIFSKNEKIVVFPNGDVITDKVYLSTAKEDYIVLTNDKIDNEYMANYINKLKEYSEQTLDVSKAIIVHNLIEKEEKEK